MTDLGTVLTDKLKVAEEELKVTQIDLAAMTQEVALKTKDLQNMNKEMKTRDQTSADLKVRLMNNGISHVAISINEDGTTTVCVKCW